MIDDVFQFILDYLHRSNNLIVWFACYAWICGTPPALMCIMLLVSYFAQAMAVPARRVFMATAMTVSFCCSTSRSISLSNSNISQFCVGYTTEVHGVATETKSSVLVRLYTKQWLLWRCVAVICDVISKSDVSSYDDDIKSLEEACAQFAQLILQIDGSMHVKRAHWTLIHILLPKCVKTFYVKTGLPFQSTALKKHNGVSRSGFSVLGTTNLDRNKYFQRACQELMFMLFGSVEAVGTHDPYDSLNGCQFSGAIN